MGRNLGSTDTLSSQTAAMAGFAGGRNFLFFEDKMFKTLGDFILTVGNVD